MKKVVFEGVEYPSIKALCDEYNVVYRYVIRNTTCRGYTLEEAIFGKRKTYHFEGKYFLSLSELCRKYDVCVQRVQQRLRSGWTLEKAVHTKTYIEYNGEKFNTHSHLCKSLGISYSGHMERIRKGVAIEESVKRGLEWKKKNG